MFILPNYKNFTWPLTHSYFPTPLSRTKEGSPQLPQPLQWDTSHTQSQSCMHSFTRSQVDAPRELDTEDSLAGKVSEPLSSWLLLLEHTAVGAGGCKGWGWVTWVLTHHFLTLQDAETIWPDTQIIPHSTLHLISPNIGSRVSLGLDDLTQPEVWREAKARSLTSWPSSPLSGPVFATSYIANGSLFPLWRS